MDSGFSRRGFLLRGFSRALGRAADAVASLAPLRHVRPPGALPEAAFVAACTRCGECARACPVGAIVMLPREAGLAAGTPALEPASVACIMCADMPCAASCPTEALALPAAGWHGTRLARLVVDEPRCLAHRGVECGVCARVCPLGAPALALDAGGRPLPGDACTGCGQCVGACVTAPSSLGIEPVREVA